MKSITPQLIAKVGKISLNIIACCRIPAPRTMKYYRILRSIYTARVGMRRGTSQRGASCHMLFFQFTLVKRCLIFLVTMASQQHDMLLALT